MTTQIRTRYASTSRGVYHIVPLIGRKVAHETLCGRRVQRWDTVTDEKPDALCQRCANVEASRGWARSLQIVRAGGERRERRV